MTWPNLNLCWGALMVEECLRQGVEYFCVAPGSRNAPLTIAIGRNPRAKVMVHFDERGLAFYAMGLASRLKQPVVVVCTSGTAVANAFPALIEARKKKIPLIMITADRPPELRQTGSVQTIDQVGIYGSYVVYSIDMPPADLAITPGYVLSTMAAAIYASRRHKGPVHLNMMCREPLHGQIQKVDWKSYCRPIQNWLKGTEPFTKYISSVSQFSSQDAKELLKEILSIKRGAFLVGKLQSEEEGREIIRMAKVLAWPIFADITSGLRLGENDKHVIHYVDHLLLTSMSKTSLDGVIHCGGRLTSKRVNEWIASMNLPTYIMVLGHSLRHDPYHQVTHRIESSLLSFLKQLRPLVKPRRDNGHLARWQNAQVKADVLIKEQVDNSSRLNEIKIARIISSLIKKGQALYLANSMPIRDMDMFACHDGAKVMVSGNRGASGIDGLIASAAGYAQAHGDILTLMIGDLSALHDLNSLAMLKDIQVPIITIVINNGGGTIFQFLPIANEKDVFRRFFLTPHGFTLASSTQGFEVQYMQPMTEEDLIKAYRIAQKSQTSTVIEVMIDHQENMRVHQSLKEAMSHVIIR